MKNCWESEASFRPPFTNLVPLLKAFHEKYRAQAPSVFSVCWAACKVSHPKIMLSLSTPSALGKPQCHGSCFRVVANLGTPSSAGFDVQNQHRAFLPCQGLSPPDTIKCVMEPGGHLPSSSVQNEGRGCSWTVPTAIHTILVWVIKKSHETSSEYGRAINQFRKVSRWVGILAVC